jgi:hypothetical protein
LTMSVIGAISSCLSDLMRIVLILSCPVDSFDFRELMILSISELSIK